MKRMLALSLTCALALASLSGCTTPSTAQPLSAQPIPLSQEQLVQYDPEATEVYAALSSFGMELLKNVRQEGTDTLISPLSVSLALAMAANGADHNTLSQFEQVLGGDASLEAINVACHALLSIYQNLLGGSTQCSIANSVWADPDGQISEEFIGRCAGIFDAQIFQEDLSASGIVPALNGWVSEHTNNMIPQIISQPFQESTAALLVNALYLKNTWAQKFDPNSTHERTFTFENGQTEDIDFLNTGFCTFPYIQGEGVQGAVLPYDDGRLGFFALLPDQDLDSWLSTLEGADFTALLSQRTDTQFLHLGLPKFEAEWRGDLSSTLAQLGLEDAFLPGVADFSQMGDLGEGSYLSQVIHATKIKVNEKGTEAAAATVVAASGSSAPAEEGITLIFDRPFLYGIVDLQNGVPLFIGTFE